MPSAVRFSTKLARRRRAANAGTGTDAGQGLEMASSTDPENLRAFMTREITRWRDVVKSSGAQLD